MSQSFIDALMHFIALLYLPLNDRMESHPEAELEDYIKKAGIMVPAADCLKVYNTYNTKYCKEYLVGEILPDKDERLLRRQLLVDTARRVQMNLYLRDRYLLILALIEYTSFNKSKEVNFIDDIKEIALALNFSRDDFNEGLKFIKEDDYEPDSTELKIEDSNEEILEGSWIEQHKPVIDPLQRHIIDNRIQGRLFIKYFEKYHLFALKYKGKKSLLLNNKKVYSEYFYSFGLNAVLQFDKTDFIYFDEIALHFNLKYNQSRIRIEGAEVSYRYPNSGYTIKPFNFREYAGQMIGIVGNNGVGKSTILKLIAGINKSFSGDILINGSGYSQNRLNLQSAIGYVSTEDMYHEELTVYENLYSHARLCMGDLTGEELKKRTEEVINKFDLQDVQYIRPIDFEAKRVTDFDKICLNIAFELIRDPYMLCLDEPLTILPFADSKRLLSILKEETFDGKIVFISVHLPSPEIYNIFDKVWFIDSGGHMIYQGGPKQALDYFHSSGVIPFRIVSAREDMISPEDIINLVETKKVRPDGIISDDRMVGPEIWYELFRKKQNHNIENFDTGKPLPVKPSSIPGIEKQFLVYLIRLLRIRFSNLKYILSTFIGIPLVGGSIAFITKYTDESGYTLSENKFLPLFLFLSVVFVFFAGMLNGAKEIMPEKSKLKRDLNLMLSHFSYTNSKVVFITLISAIQTFILTLVCHYILKIEGLLLTSFLIYFSIAVLAGMLALIFSSAFKTLTMVYILIPFLVIPNLLFSGYLLPYNEPSDVKQYSPLAAYLVPGQWAYEALMVNFFAFNKFNRLYFDNQFKHYQTSFLKDEVIPLLFESLDECNSYYTDTGTDEKLDSCLQIFRNELYYISEIEEVAPYASFSNLYADTFSESVFNDIFGYLTYLDFYFEAELLELEEDLIYPDSVTSADTALSLLKKYHHSKAIQDIVFNNNMERQVRISKHHIIKKGKPVYLMPDDHYGRAHFFAPYKRVGGQILFTSKFNLNALWTMILVFYFIFATNLAVLFFDLFRKKKEMIIF